MGMIQTDDFLIRVTKVCPPGFNFNIGNQIELTIFINGSFRNLVAGTECKLFNPSEQQHCRWSHCRNQGESTVAYLSVCGKALLFPAEI